MTANKVLLIGESPSKAETPADQALAGRIGKRLAQLLGLSESDYFATFDRVNLLPAFIGKRPGEAAAKWPAQEASIAADQMRTSGLLSARPLVILFGTRVAAAFGVQSEWFAQTSLPLGDDAQATVIVVPHPSGANRWWNSAANKKQAQKFFRKLSKQLGFGYKRQPIKPKGEIPEPGDIGDGSDLTELPESVKSAFEPLTPIERRFVVAYCGPARGNAQLAGKMAGVDQMQTRNKDKERNAQHMAQYVYAWTHGTRTKKAIEAWMEAHALGAIELTHLLADAARANAGVFLERLPNGLIKIKPPSDFVWESHKHWLKSVETGKDGVVTRLETVDPMAARREIAKILKLYSDQPILAINLFLQGMSDADLLAKLNELKALQAGAERAADTMRQLPATVDADVITDDADTLEYDPDPEV